MQKTDGTLFVYVLNNSKFVNHLLGHNAVLIEQPGVTVRLFSFHSKDNLAVHRGVGGPDCAAAGRGVIRCV